VGKDWPFALEKTEIVRGRLPELDGEGKETI